MTHMTQQLSNRSVLATVAALVGLVVAAETRAQVPDPAIYELPANMTTAGTRLESHTASNPANSKVTITPPAGSPTVVTGKSVIMLSRVSTEVKAVPGSQAGEALGYVYDALVIDGVATIRPDRTLELDRGKLFLKVDEAIKAQASAVPWWYPIVVGQATQSGVISTEFIVQRKPMAWPGSDLERTFLVKNASNLPSPPADLWISRTVAPSGGGVPLQRTLRFDRSYVLAQENRDQPLTERSLNPADFEGESGVANGIYDNAVAWAIRAGLHAP